MATVLSPSALATDNPLGGGGKPLAGGGMTALLSMNQGELSADNPTGGALFAQIYTNNGGNIGQSVQGLIAFQFGTGDRGTAPPAVKADQTAHL